MKTLKKRLSSKRSFFSNIALVGISTMTALVAAELLIYFLGLAPQVLVLELDPERGREYETFQLSENPVLIYEPVQGTGSFNKLKFRGPMPSQEDSSKTRIVFSGDSQTYGVSFPFEKAFPKLAEDKFVSNNLKIKIYNVAVPGYSFEQEVERVRTVGLSLQPNHVVIGLNRNDFYKGSGELTRFKELLQNERGLIPAEINAFRTPALKLLIQSNLFRIFTFGTKSSTNPLRNFENLGRHLDVRSVEKILDQLESLSKSRGFSYSFIILPTPVLDRWDHFKTLGFQEAFEKRGLNVWNMHRFFNAKFNFKPEETRRFFLKDDEYHFNEEGHKLAGNMLFENREKWLR